MKKISSLILFALLLAGCYEDKGNYVYSDVEQIEITLPEGLSVMANSEYIIFDPEHTWKKKTMNLKLLVLSKQQKTTANASLTAVM